jgi:biopolymer transport protein ExbB/TolQ
MTWPAYIFKIISLASILYEFEALFERNLLPPSLSSSILKMQDAWSLEMLVSAYNTVAHLR